MIKIALYCERTNDQCSWYRATGPFSDPIFRKNDIHFRYITNYDAQNWADVSDCDIVFILRPYNKQHHDVMIMAMSGGKKVWLDFDDDFTVPEQCAWSEQHIKTQIYFTQSILMANKITVSTPSIKDVYEKLTPKAIEVIPNGFNFDLLKNMQRKTRKMTKTLAWRGSATHDKDLQEVAVSFAHTMKKHPDYMTYFYGSYPKFLAYYVNHTYLNFPTLQYHNVLADQQHKILMHPLEHTQWNTGKSNAAWLEGTMSGATILSRDLPEWRVPNCYTYKTTEEFSLVLDKLLSMGEDEHEKSVSHGKSYIAEHRNLSKLNERRLSIIMELVG